VTSHDPSFLSPPRGAKSPTHPQISKIKKFAKQRMQLGPEAIIQSTCKSGNGQELNPELGHTAARRARSGAELVTELIVAVPVRSLRFSRRATGPLLLRGTCRPGTLSSSACTPAQYSLRNIPTPLPPLTR
jgi:hypothetical protein